MTEKRFPPSPEFSRRAWIGSMDKYREMYRRSIDDPERFWQICDANRAMWPDDLTQTVGRRLRITLPEGIPGVASA